MKLVNKIKFLLSLFTIKESDYNKMIAIKEDDYNKMVEKSKKYDELLYCIEITTEAEYYEAYDGIRYTIFKTQKSIGISGIIDADRLTSIIGIPHSNPIKWSIKSKESELVE
jgi:hypothetical protein